MKPQAPTQEHAREFSRLIDRYLDLERLREEVRKATLRAITRPGQKSRIRLVGSDRKKNGRSAA
jgi:hypothetical protein